MFQVHAEDLATFHGTSKFVERFDFLDQAKEAYLAKVQTAQDGTWTATRPYVSLSEVVYLARIDRWDIVRVIDRYAN